MHTFDNRIALLESVSLHFLEQHLLLCSCQDVHGDCVFVSMYVVECNRMTSLFWFERGTGAVGADRVWLCPLE